MPDRLNIINVALARQRDAVQAGCAGHPCPDNTNLVNTLHQHHQTLLQHQQQQQQQNEQQQQSEQFASPETAQTGVEQPAELVSQAANAYTDVAISHSPTFQGDTVPDTPTATAETAAKECAVEAAAEAARNASQGFRRHGGVAGADCSVDSLLNLQTGLSSRQSSPVLAAAVTYTSLDPDSAKAVSQQQVMQPQVASCDALDLSTCFNMLDSLCEHQLAWLSVCLSNPYVCQPACLPACLFVRLPVPLSVSVSVRLPICLSVCRASDSCICQLQSITGVTGPSLYFHGIIMVQWSWTCRQCCCNIELALQYRSLRQCFCMKTAHPLEVHPMVCRDQCSPLTCWGRLKACKGHFRSVDRHSNALQTLPLHHSSSCLSCAGYNCQGHDSQQLAQLLLLPGVYPGLCWRVSSTVHDLAVWSSLSFNRQWCKHRSGLFWADSVCLGLYHSSIGHAASQTDHDCVKSTDFMLRCFLQFSPAKHLVSSGSQGELQDNVRKLAGIKQAKHELSMLGHKQDARHNTFLATADLSCKMKR